MEAIIIAIPFLLYVYLHIKIGNHKTTYEADTEELKFGSELFDSNQIPQAFRYFNQILTDKPKSAFAYFMRGKCHFEFENYEAALLDFEKASRLENTLAEIFYFKAKTLNHLNQYEAAKIAYKMASRMYLNQNTDVLIALARIEIRLVDFEGAKKTLKLASSLGDKHADNLLQQYSY